MEKLKMFNMEERKFSLRGVCVCVCGFETAINTL